MSSASDVEADVVVAQSLPLGLIRSLHRAGVRLVFDLYAPALVEAAANLAGEQSADRSDGIRYEEVVAVTRVALQLGDAFLCASDRQRDHWLGALAALGRVSPEVYGRDPALRSLVAVVPFGLDPAPPSLPGRGEGRAARHRRGRSAAALGRRSLELVRPADRDPCRRAAVGAPGAT